MSCQPEVEVSAVTAAQLTLDELPHSAGPQLTPDHDPYDIDEPALDAIRDVYRANTQYT